MTSSRPGTKIRFWSPKFTNRPDVEPPTTLKLAGALSVVSVVGVLIYAISAILGTTVAEDRAIYIAVLHFVLPLCVFYTISVNSPLSRIAIGIYATTLSVATFLGRGVLGTLTVSEGTRAGACVAFLALVLYWLFGSPKMRYYYALISGRRVPEDLRPRASELQGGASLSPRARATVEWFVDRLETVVVLGFIAAVIYAWWSTSQ